jgi:hypothetical protein
LGNFRGEPVYVLFGIGIFDSCKDYQALADAFFLSLVYGYGSMLHPLNNNPHVFSLF